MAQKITLLDMIGFSTENTTLARGDLAIRLAKVTYEDGQVISREAHRFSLQAGEDISVVLDEVDAFLLSEGFPAIGSEDADLISAVASIRWTEDVIKAQEEQQQINQEAARQAEAAAQARQQEEQAARQAEIAAAVEAVLAAREAPE